MVTAELAVTFPAIVLVLVGALAGVGWGIARVQCVDAARVMARELARGESPATAMVHGARAAPAGAGLSTGATGREVTATVTVEPPSVLAWSGPAAECSAVALRESAGDEVAGDQVAADGAPG